MTNANLDNGNTPSIGEKYGTLSISGTRNEVFWKVHEADSCPFYTKGDIFTLDRLNLSTPQGKPVCISLCRSLGEKTDNGRIAPIEDPLKCDGQFQPCKGMVKLKTETPRASLRRANTKVHALADTVKSLSFFRNFDEASLPQIVEKLHFAKRNPGEILIHKGEKPRKVFVVASGRVEVSDGETILAHLDSGEVFGEMSHLNDTAAGATVSVVQPSWIIAIDGDEFSNLLNSHPALQMYFVHLLTARLSRTNFDRTSEFTDGMSGKLVHVPPVELFQLFNHNLKTGVLQLKLPKGGGTLVFRKGELVKVSYDKVEGADAFYRILQEEQGRFRFVANKLPRGLDTAEPVGDFMALLLEGLRRLDEKQMRIV